MGWLYDNSFDESFDESFNVFIKECLIDKKTIILQQKLYNQEKNQHFRIIIKTDGNNDNIISINGKIYSKNRFLKSRSFKKNLIDYYNPLNIYVKGPKEILKRNGISLNKWIIDLIPHQKS